MHLIVCVSDVGRCVHLIVCVSDVGPTWPVALQNENAEVFVWKLLQQTVERLLQYYYSNVFRGYYSTITVMCLEDTTVLLQ